MLGKIPFPDRVQRVLVGSCLMLLTIFGLLESSNWWQWTALALQVELLVTGLFGWCPVYWACRVSRTQA